eukprot:TRINITY_DN2640_c0_g1_i1.p2 TRINITY_DN2640_c0_g1~~TRINITY_DN2640_c0_g1_i1.p2  ORF type:complete len:221 (+),score=56.67 TRINITY_DN2640_c0_g1_i1:158-820(+)
MAAAAAPLPVTYSPTTALLVVDVQNDFCHPDGSLSLPRRAWGAADHQRAHCRCRRRRRPGRLHGRLAPASDPPFRHGGRHVARPLRGRHLGRPLFGGPHPRRRRGRPQGRGGEDGYSGFGARVVVLGGDGAAGGAGGGEAAKGHGGEVVDTGLTALLTARGVRSVVIVGVAGDVCVRATALDAVAGGWATALVRGGVAYVDAGAVGRVEAELTAAGVRLL